MPTRGSEATHAETRNLTFLALTNKMRSSFPWTNPNLRQSMRQSRKDKLTAETRQINHLKMRLKYFTNDCFH